MTAERIARLEQRLRAALDPAELEIEDDGAAHAGHAGARQGGHFNVVVVSEAFVGKPLLARHRLVYEAAGDMMQTDIHALSIKALTPEER